MRFLLYYHFLALTIAQVFCECGKTVVRVNSLTGPGFPTEHVSFPWHVGVYYMNWTSGGIDNYCGGSLISPDWVISAAHCFYKEDERRVDDAFNYAVAAGKIQRSYYELEDGEQKSHVKTIHVPDGYVGLRGNYAEDIAVLRLRRSFAITEYVNTVCIDWASTYTGAHLRSGEYGKVMGWGLIGEGYLSKALQKITLPYIDHDHCRAGTPEDFKNLVTRDKICAGSTNVSDVVWNVDPTPHGSSVCRGDAGGGYCFQSDGRWYLRGVVSVDASPGNSTCDNNYYSAFTNVEHYLDWIREFLHDSDCRERDSTIVSSSTGSCSLPEQPEGGRFEQHSSGKSSVYAAGSRVPIDSVLIYRCNEGYTLRGNDYSICEDGGWTPPPTCVRSCHALRFASVDVLCEYNGEIVPCDSAMAPGTRATLKCKNYYKISPALKEITCLKGGVWTSPEFQCIPECGIAESMETPLIVNGSRVMHGSFPWHVAIYYKHDKQLLTAGTLIKPDLIVSKASDLYDKNTKKPWNADFVVAAGKYYKSYDELEPYAQTSSVKKIYLHDDYSDEAGNYAHDIALLRLETPFAMSKLVRPVCLDRSAEIAGGFSEVWKFPGWSIDKPTSAHDVYFEVEGRFVNRASCLSSVVSYSHRELTSDKSCWKPTGNESLQSLLTAAYSGIYAEKDNTWYLAGFAGKHYYPLHNLLLSTNVDTFRSFILKVERN